LRGSNPKVPEQNKLGKVVSFIIRDVSANGLHIHKKKWSDSNLSSMIRIQLITYINLFKFLESPDHALINYLELSNPNRAPTLFD